MSEPRSFVILNASGIRKLMAKRNVSCIEVAKALRIKPTYFSQLLSGYRRPSPKLRVRIQRLRVFRGRGCRWEDIFTLEYEIADI